MSHQRRVFAEILQSSGDIVGREISLSDNDSHHLLRVLRLELGSAVTVVLRPSGEEFEAVVSGTEHPARIRLVREKARRGGCSRVQSLSLALTKGATTNLVCEKACELGVRQVIFWEAARSVVHVRSEQEKMKKLERWIRIAESAAKQSLKSFIPEVLFVGDLFQLLAKIREVSSPLDSFFCCSLAPSAQALRELATPRGHVHLVVGPEGDFAPAEEEALSGHSFQLVSLGASVLRSETAAIAAIAMIDGLWGE